MRRSNCVIFALWLFFRRGGYIHIRPSRHIWGLHWSWSAKPDVRYWLGYEPVTPKNLPEAIWDKVWFKGRIVRRDRRR